MLERVLELARSLYPVSEGKEMLLENLCRAACGRLDSQLREGVTEEEYADAYVTAAVWLALDGMTAAGQSGGIKKFSAGDLTVETDGGVSEELTDKAWELMRPYLKDREFAFRGVRG